MKQNKLVKGLLLVIATVLIAGGQAYAAKRQDSTVKPGDQIPRQHTREKVQHSVRREAAKRLRAQYQAAKANELQKQIQEHGRRHKGAK